MTRNILTCVAVLGLALTGAAQTTGIPGVNDVAVNGVGSGGTSCISVQINSGDPWMTVTDAQPFSAVIAAVANQCIPDQLSIDPTYDVDLDLNSLNYLFDGTGFIVNNGLTLLAQTNSFGSFVFTINTSEIYRADFGYQLGFVHPSFVNDIGTSQAFSVSIRAAELLPGGTDVSPLSDDGFVNFTFGNAGGFNFYGVNQTDVWVNMNGNLTFSSGDSDWTSSESEMLSDQPRIAPAWDDWTPSDASQGTVRYLDTATSFAVEWYDVRHFSSANCGNGKDTNTFSVTLSYATGEIEFGYGAMLLCQQGSAPSPDQVVGISPGNGGSVANNIDLSGGLNVGGSNLAMYEDFSQTVFGPFDLSHLTCCLNQVVLFMPSSGTAYDQTLQ